MLLACAYSRGAIVSKMRRASCRKDTAARNGKVPATMVKDMAFIAYSVRDVPAATSFYRDVIGLKPGESFGEHWVEFDVGSTTFGIGNGESLGFEPGKSTGASFEVDNIDEMRERLAASGAEVSEVHKFPNCSACFAKDPEGNRFALHQRASAER